MIDIRELPVIYINLPQEIERNEYMIKQLTDWGFTRFKRFSAYKTGDGNVYPAVICGHCKALYDAYHDYATDDYIIVMEDDVHFNNISKYNHLLTELSKNDQFKVLVQTIPDGNPRVYDPPLKPAHAHMHFCIYKRKTIPIMSHSLFESWLRTGYNDQWWDHGLSGIYTYTGDECMQVNYYFPSSSVNRTDITYQFILVLCDFPLEGLDIYEAIARALKVSPFQLSANIANAKKLLMRIIRVNTKEKYIEHLDILNHVQRFCLSEDLNDNIQSGDVQSLITFAVNNNIIPNNVKMNISICNRDLLSPE